MRFTAGNAGYIAGTIIAVFYPIVALIIFGLLAIYYLFEHLPDAAGGDGQPAASDRPAGATGRS